MPQLGRFDATRAILIGIVIPVLIAITDRWLLAREMQPLGGQDIATAQAMAWFVLQVGMFGVLCGRFIDPPGSAGSCSAGAC